MKYPTGKPKMGGIRPVDNGKQKMTIDDLLAKASEVPIPLKDNEFYWLWAPALNPTAPLMIGLYDLDRWWFGEGEFNPVPGITAIQHILKPLPASGEPTRDFDLIKDTRRIP